MNIINTDVYPYSTHEIDYKADKDAYPRLQTSSLTASKEGPPRAVAGYQLGSNRHATDLPFNKESNL